MAENQDRQPVRAALYVDGFNLYYPLDKRGENWLKWLNLWKLGEILVEGTGEKLVKVLYCSAKREDNADGGRDRHNTYMNALRTAGVEILLGHYMTGETPPCEHCGFVGSKPTEKQTDINLALSLILDGLDDVYDKAYLLSADSDQAATARVFKERCPDKVLVSVAPLDQDVSRKVAQYASQHKKLSILDIERSVFPGLYVSGSAGIIRRPDEYAPPSWWKHPNNRKRKS